MTQVSYYDVFTTRPGCLDVILLLLSFPLLLFPPCIIGCGRALSNVSVRLAKPFFDVVNDVFAGAIGGNVLLVLLLVLLLLFTKEAIFDLLLCVLNFIAAAATVVLVDTFILEFQDNVQVSYYYYYYSLSYTLYYY